MKVAVATFILVVIQFLSFFLLTAYIYVHPIGRREKCHWGPFRSMDRWESYEWFSELPSIEFGGRKAAQNSVRSTRCNLSSHVIQVSKKTLMSIESIYFT